jgi:hypothetical protein
LTRTQRRIDVLRQGNACIQVQAASGSPCAGIAVSVEQETHKFVFGCVVPELSRFSDVDRQRYGARLEEVFNCVVRAGMPPTSGPGIIGVEVADPVPLGILRVRLDRLAATGAMLQIHLWGAAAGMSGAVDGADLNDRDIGRRVADLYALCFAHPSVGSVWWHGLADGEDDVRGGGLLRRDLAPKYAHKVLQKLIGSLWHTRAAGLTDEAGRFCFKGFFGDYRAVAKVGGVNVLVQIVAFQQGRSDVFKIDIPQTIMAH